METSYQIKLNKKSFIKIKNDKINIFMNLSNLHRNNNNFLAQTIKKAKII